ncbi:aldo/keto reductase [Cohnella sp. REN36]|uniref:aldo/keto reductase n=1 Tax=Cohnella sp. REN36 TaxID=2887347 RepID=UPI001D14B7D0|nr:aldo/keto reductase [Cohnella sp. REN36]MCC3371470.1 aldo/keto reductase [Cohnella sp. REN36]
MKKMALGPLEVSPLGLGCWAIGGPFTLGGIPDGWGEVDDRESEDAIRAAIERGIDFFDTADVYGTGRSEEVLGRAIQGRRHEVVIATKFGFTYDSGTKEVFVRHDVTPAYIRQACERSLRRLGTDYIDLYQIHVGSLSREELHGAIDALDELRRDGWIRAYGWSTEDATHADLFARHSAAVALQHPLNVLRDEPGMIDVCERHGLASINNSPLAMGLLSGKFDRESRLAPTDVRGGGHAWVAYFKEGRVLPSYLERLEAVREILTGGGRTLVQGALAWIWGRSWVTVPIPGFKTKAQAMELAGAMEFGPLTTAQMAEIDRVLSAAS